MTFNLNFLGGEVEDIIAEDEMANRNERMEPLSVWSQRMVRAGFYLKKDIPDLPRVTHPNFTLRQYGGYVGVQYKHRTIVGVIAAQVNKYDR